MIKNSYTVLTKEDNDTWTQCSLELREDSPLLTFSYRPLRIIASGLQELPLRVLFFVFVGYFSTTEMLPYFMS